MRTRIFIWVAALMDMVVLSTSILADPPKPKAERNDDSVPVFVTGSLIPQRIKLHSTGTKTVSPMRIIGRTEIDQNGRASTPGALINDPAVQLTPH